jgi:urease accessory protein
MNRFVLAALPAAVLAATALSVGPALAHTGAGSVSGLGAGFGHPIGGLDHLLAMIAVGVLAVQLGGRATLLVPAAFVAMMVGGGLLGAAAVGLPLVEIGIVGSVIVLGGAIALGRRMPVALAMGLVGAFALFHGHAHGTEMPITANGLEYGLGFALATTLLHVAGIGAGLAARVLGAQASSLALRTGGGAIAAAGLMLAIV